MAPTNGFLLSDLSRPPIIPGQIGHIDFGDVYDNVVKGIQAHEQARGSTLRQSASDAQLLLAAQRAQTESGLLGPEAAARTATAGATQILNAPDVVGAEAAAKRATNEESARNSRYLLAQTPAEAALFTRSGPQPEIKENITHNADGTITHTKKTIFNAPGNQPIAGPSSETTQREFALEPSEKIIGTKDLGSGNYINTIQISDPQGTVISTKQVPFKGNFRLPTVGNVAANATMALNLARQNLQEAQASGDPQQIAEATQFLSQRQQELDLANETQENAKVLRDPVAISLRSIQLLKNELSTEIDPTKQATIQNAITALQAHVDRVNSPAVHQPAGFAGLQKSLIDLQTQRAAATDAAEIARLDAAIANTEAQVKKQNQPKGVDLAALAAAIGGGGASATAAPKNYKTVDEALAAGAKPGDRVIIDGHPGTLKKK